MKNLVAKENVPTFAIAFKRDSNPKKKGLPYGVMVAHLILDQLVNVRIIVGQHKRKNYSIK